MRQECYVLRFHRPPHRPTDAAVAPGLQIQTLLVEGSFKSMLTEDGEPTAAIALDFKVNRAGTLFFESGTLTFPGDPDGVLYFSSIGTGSLSPQPYGDGFSQGTVMYSVDGGTGAFEGAQGAITSNFLVNLETDELIDTHLGVLRLP